MKMNNFGGVGGTPTEIALASGLCGDDLARHIKQEFGHYLSLSAGVDQLTVAPSSVPSSSQR